MNDEQLLRYSRHILLDEWGVSAQQQLARSHAVVVGAGGLGSPALLFLASAGVARITVIDPDVVDLTNLQRQIAHTQARLGQTKVESARQAMLAINPEIQVDALVQAADAAWLAQHIPQADVVLDCTDRFATRQMINRACMQAGKPLVWAAALRFDAQLSVADPRDPRCPCYACVFPPDEAPQETLCATMGVFAPLVGIVGSMQAAEALKLLTNVAPCARGRLLMLDARSMRQTEIRIERRPGCSVCGRPTTN